MIVVTGMHRSGTSFLCQLLRELGLDFGDPETLLAADPANPAGYLEARDVLDVNSRILTGFPRSQGGPRGLLEQVLYLRMPDVPTICRRAARYTDALAAAAARVADLAVKDPRFCLTLPVWRDHAAISRVVVSVRHPLAVAASLRRRQRVPARVALRFWAYHVRALLDTVPAGAGHFVDFDTLRGPSGPAALAGVARYLALPEDDATIDRVLTTTLREDLGRESAAGQGALTGAVGELWEALCARMVE